MPNLVNADGSVVAPSLTKDELEVLSENGVSFDLESEDTDADGDSGEAIPDPEGDESIDVDNPESGDEGDGEGDTSPSGEETAESESEGDSDVPDDAEVSDDEDVEGDTMMPESVSGELDEMEHHISPDEELVEDMATRDMDEEMAEKFDIDVDEVHRTDDRDIERWHRLLKQLSEYGTDVEQRKRERDDRIGSIRVRESAEALEQRARQSGAVQELKDGFRKLVSRPTPRPATFGPQIDPYNVTRRAAGDMTITELFEEHVEVETGERCVGLATDISGSMRGDITELKIAGGVIAEATQIIGDEFVWEAFTDKNSRTHEPPEERLDLRIVTGPNEQFKWEHVDSFTDAYNEPTAAGIRDCRMLMEQTQARQHVMIVITDGVALVEEDGTYSGRSGAAIDHARRAVEECRQAGYEVIGLGIGGMDEEDMEATFGKDQMGNPNYSLTSIDTLAEDILEIYRGQLNVSR